MVTACSGLAHAASAADRQWGHNGEFSGSITIDGDLTQELVIDGPVTSAAEIWIKGKITGAGDANGKIWIQNNEVANSPMSGVIKIDSSLISTSEIDIDRSSGLVGQIIINAVASGGVWNGDVIVGSTTLEDGYSNTAASLGGGSVGEVPFKIHRESCDPVHDSVQTTDPTDATMQFYGPVKPKATGRPARVYRGPKGSGNFGDFTNVSSSYMMTVSGNQVVISGTFPGEYRYWFKPIESGILVPGETKLLCDELTTATETVVSAGDYWFDVE